jgi:hypothetical protein
VDAYPDVKIDRPDLFDFAFGILGSAQGFVAIAPKITVSAGSYAGTAAVRACKDPACTTVLASAPFSYTISMKPGLKVTPSSLVFDVPAGSTTTQYQSFQIALPTDPGFFSYTSNPLFKLYSTNNPALSVGYQMVASNNNSSWTVSIDPTNVAPGTYQGSVRFFYTLSGSTPKDLVQDLTITLLVK